jgi:hypothetical protein
MKKPPEAYWTLWKVIHARVAPHIKAGIHPGMLNPVFGLPQAKNIPKGPGPSANERYWIGWMEEFTEINSSIERLNQTLVYMTHFPASRAFRFHGLTEADWLRFHIEVYMQEVYILHSRLTHFLRRVEKTAIASRDKGGLILAKSMQRTVDTSLDAILKVRGRHVHEYRFQDPELRNLDSLVLITKAGKVRQLRFFRRLKYLAALEKWRKQLLNNNKELQKMCVFLFEEATAILTRNEPALV